MLGYALQRCTAIFLAVAIQFETDGGAELKETIGRYRDGAAQFFRVAVEVSGSPDGQVSANVAEIVPLYREEMRANYLATGNRMEGLVADDVTLCSEISRSTP